MISQISHRAFIASIVITLLLSACSSSELVRTSVILGEASPIKLRYDSTTVLLSDYLPDSQRITSIQWNGAYWKMNETSAVTLKGAAPSPISNLHVVVESAHFDIPVFASTKQAFTFTYKSSKPDVQVVEMAGSINGWNRKATPLVKKSDGWQIELILEPGTYTYRIWEDGSEMLDANQPETMDNGMGGLNSVFRVGQQSKEADSAPLFVSHTKPLTIASSGSIDALYMYSSNQLIRTFSSDDVTKTDDKGMSFIQISDELLESAQMNGNELSNIRFYGYRNGVRLNDVYVPVRAGHIVMHAEEVPRQEMRSSVMYFAMVDRFNNGNTSNDRPTKDPSILPKANNLGGDLEGITKKINDGYFQRLGVNTIWISPISKNAEGAWGLWEKGVRSTFSAYHGYWPTALRSIDDRLGSDASFRGMIETAHADQMNVVLDYVAHHVHQDHPLYKQKPEWTTPLYLPDGTMNTERWDEYRLTTWFDTFLPTWKFANPEVVEALSDTAMFWVKEYDLDGFRHDATKHIDEAFWRALTMKVKDYLVAHPDRKLYQIGETYGNPELISSYVNSGEMDAQFDFNLYDAAVDAFGKSETGYERLSEVLQQSLSTYGSHHLMGNITGNQDRARFTSYADGSVDFAEDPKLAGWTRDIQHQGDIGYQRMAMLTAFMLFVPGVPCIYYGDEIGMPGANDPDNRRMMHFGDWNASEQDLFDQVSKMIHTRRKSLALQYGETFVIEASENVIVIGRRFGEEMKLFVATKDSRQPSPLTLNIDPSWSGEYKHIVGSLDVRIENDKLLIPTGAASYGVIQCVRGRH
jgi:cyclomaltodextrinase